jgi:hypothetical protein
MLAMLRRSVLTVAVLFVSFACGSSPTGPSDVPGGSTPSTAGAPGSLTVRITDRGAYQSARAVLVTFSEVSVQRGNDWTKLPFPDPNAPTWTCDLKKLENSNADFLGSGTPQQGEYTWVRVLVESVTLYPNNSTVSTTPCARTIPAPAGDAYPVTVAQREGRDNGSIPVTSTDARTILIDFNSDASITDLGGRQYSLNPIVRLVSVQ